MSRSIFLLALLLLISLQCAGQMTGTKSAAAARPVKNLASQTPSAASIHFAGFEFQQPYLGREGPGFWPIDGEPSNGLRYVVEATLYGEEAIATAKFEAVDGVGHVIQQIFIQRRPDASGRSGFYGLMMVPDRPFRVVVSGEGVDGRSYRRAHVRLFRPTNRPPRVPRIPPGVHASDAKRMEQLADAAAQEAIAKMENDLRKDAGGVIVMPRTRVSNVMYAPYLSKAGHPLGVRIQYSPSMQAAWRAILASKAPTKYKLYIDNADFSGEIEGLHAQGTLFQSFVAEGAQDCGEQPTNRF